jgi:glutamate 2,3-aminomutase
MTFSPSDLMIETAIDQIIDEKMARLEDDIADYLAYAGRIPTGFDQADRIQAQKRRILRTLNASESDWQDYRWQLANRFRDAGLLGEILGLRADEMDDVTEVGRQYRFAVSPYYLSLADPGNPDCPVRRQSVPCRAELLPGGVPDPMSEAECCPVPGVTRRYPDRLVINVTNQCGMYCRFCQRRRLIGEQDRHSSPAVIDGAIRYVEDHPEIRDVLLTGGDALMLSDRQIDSLLSRLRKISHVEIIRLGTRTPVTLPQRITPDLVGMLKKYHPVYVNTHFNSPADITPDSERACGMLADAGIPLGNQMVLLNGINNHKFIVRKLNQLLLMLRVRPYYIFHPKQVSGTAHFWVRLEEGLEIMESLRGFTSGLAVPTYIVNGTGGLGKTPLIPNYLLYIGTDKAVFRNWEGRTFEIDNQFTQLPADALI